MRTEQIEALLKIVECGSINKASLELRLSHQRLSHNIKLLENEFGTQFFNRSSKGIELTPHGAAIVAELRDITNRLEALKSQIHHPQPAKQACGSIEIYRELEVFQDYWLSFLPYLTNKFPHLIIKSIDAHYEYICEKLCHPGSCIGIVNIFDADRHSLPEELTFIPVTTRVPVVYVAQHHPFARSHKSTSLATIVRKPLIDYVVFPSQTSFLQKIFHGIGEPQVKYSVSNYHLFEKILLSEDCMFVFTRPARHLIQAANIAIIPLRDKIGIHFGFLLNKNLLEDPVIQLFIEQYRQYYKPVL